MFWAVVLSNVPELFMGAAWSGLMIYLGYRLGSWRTHRKNTVA